MCFIPLVSLWWHSLFFYTCNDIITSVKDVGFLWCIITHNPLDHIIWTNYSLSAVLLAPNRVQCVSPSYQSSLKSWCVAPLQHRNTVEYLARDAIGAERKRKQRENKRKRWSHLPFPTCVLSSPLKLFHYAESMRAVQRFINCVLSPERGSTKVSQSDRERGRVGTKEKKRRDGKEK